MEGSFSVGLEQAPISQDERIKLLRERREIDRILEEETEKRCLVDNLRQKAEQSLVRLQTLESERDKIAFKAPQNAKISLKRLDTEIGLELEQSTEIKSSLEDAELNLARAQLNSRKVNTKLSTIENQEEILHHWQERRMLARQDIEDANTIRREKTIEARREVLHHNEKVLEIISDRKVEQQKAATVRNKDFSKITRENIQRGKHEFLMAEKMHKNKRLEAILNLKQNIEKSRNGEKMPKKQQDKVKSKEKQLEELTAKIDKEFSIKEKSVSPCKSNNTHQKKPLVFDPSLEEIEEKIRQERIAKALRDEKLERKDPLERLSLAQIDSIETLNEVREIVSDDEKPRELITLQSGDNNISHNVSEQDLPQKIPSWIDESEQSKSPDKKIDKTALALRKITDNSIKRHREGLMKPKVQQVCHRTFSGAAFACSTKEIVFENVIPYENYEKTVQMTNISYSMNSLKLTNVIGALSDFVTVSLEQKSGHLSAGMSLNLTIKLNTKVSKNLEGRINFLCSTGPFSLQIFSYLPRFLPVFSETNLDFGNVVIGQAISKKFVVRNIGKLGGSVTINPAENMKGDFEIQNEAFDTFRLCSNEEKELCVKFYGNDPGKRESFINLEFTSDEVITDHTESRTALQVFENEEVEELDKIDTIGEKSGEEEEADQSKLEDVAIKLIACTLECPIHLEDDILDVKMCFVRQLYQIPFMIDSKATTSIKIKMNIPVEAQSFIQVLPEDAVIQGQTRVTALTRVSCERLPKNSEYFNAETGLFDVPIEIRLQSHEKATPAIFRIVGILSTDELSASVDQLDFGPTKLEEETVHTVLIKNHSQHISRTVGIIGCPSWLTVTPNFCKILPGENLPVTFRFRPSPDQGLSYTEKVQLRCVETPGFVWNIDVRGELIAGPLKLSENKISFGGVCIGDVVDGRVELFHTGNLAGDFSFRVLEDEIVENGQIQTDTPEKGKMVANSDTSGQLKHSKPLKRQNVGNSRLIDYQLQVAPGCNMVTQGSRIGLALRTCPVLNKGAVNERFKTIYASTLISKKEEAKKAHEERQNLSRQESANSKSSGKKSNSGKKGGKNSGKKGGGKKGEKEESVLNLTNKELSDFNADEIELSEDDISRVQLQVKSELFDEIDFSENTHFTVPIVIACGSSVDPTSSALGTPSKLKYLPNATLYLNIQISVSKPTIVVNRTLDFGKVTVGTSQVKHIFGEKLDRSRKLRYRMSPVIDACGIFSLHRVLRDSEPEDGENLEIYVKCDTSNAMNRNGIFQEEPMLEVFDAFTNQMLNRVKLSMIVQTVLPIVGFLEETKYRTDEFKEFNLKDVEKRPDSRSAVSLETTQTRSSKSDHSKTSSQIEFAIEKSNFFDRFIEFVHQKQEHTIDFGIVPSKTIITRSFEIKNLNSVELDLFFDIKPDANSDMSPDGITSIFSVLPARKMKLKPGDYEKVTIQAESKFLESVNSAVIEIFAENYQQVLHKVKVLCVATSLPVFVRSEIDNDSFVGLNGCKSSYNLDSENSSNSNIVFSKKLYFNNENRTSKLDLGVLFNQTVKSIEFSVGNMDAVTKLGFSVDNLKFVIPPGGKEALKIEWNPNDMITRQPGNIEIQDKLKNWVDVDRAQEASFSITAKAEANHYVWNVYVTAVL